MQLSLGKKYARSALLLDCSHINALLRCDAAIHGRQDIVQNTGTYIHLSQHDALAWFARTQIKRLACALRIRANARWTSETRVRRARISPQADMPPLFSILGSRRLCFVLESSWNATDS
jgi:hypothetical protein